MNYTRKQLLPNLVNYRLEIRVVKDELKYCIINNVTDVVEFSGGMLPEMLPVLYHLEAGLDAAMAAVNTGTMLETSKQYLANAESLEEMELDELLYTPEKPETKNRLN